MSILDDGYLDGLHRESGFIRGLRAAASIADRNGAELAAREIRSLVNDKDCHALAQKTGDEIIEILKARELIS